MTYRAMPLPRFLVSAILAVFAVVAAVMVVAAAHGSGPPVAFLAFWIAAFGWNAYWWAWRVCTEVRLDGSTLSWRTAVRSGQAPVGDVTRVRPSRWNRQMAVIALQGRRPLLVPVRHGFAELARGIAAGAPGAVVDMG